MSLKINNQEELFTANNELVGFLTEDDPMIIFSKEIYPKFKDSDFEAYYSKIGRSAVSPSLLACVTILQYMENIPDEAAAGFCVKRIDWKIALHLPLTGKDFFESSTLCYFRKRLKEHDALSLIFDQVLQIVVDKGLIKKHAKQRIDATHVISHVNRIGTTDLLFQTVKCLVNQIKKINKSFYDEHLPELLKERYLNQFSSFGLSKDKRHDRQAEIVEDGYLLKQLLELHDKESITDYTQLSVMETIFDENIIVNKKILGEKEVIEVEEIQRPQQTIFDPKDLSLKMGKKGKTSWVGSKCHIVETAEPGKINFITNMLYQQAHSNDNQMHEAIQNGNEMRGLLPLILLADSNYVSSEAIHDYSERGQKLMGYVQSTSNKKAEAFKTDKFYVDVQRFKVWCPHGKQSEKYSLSSEEAKEKRIHFYFNKSDCSSCPDKELCLNKNDNKKKLSIGIHYDKLQSRRLEQKKDSFKKRMRPRAQIEATISEAVRAHGLRYTKYRHEDGQQLQFYLTGAALNTKRFLKALKNGSLELNKSSG